MYVHYTDFYCLQHMRRMGTHVVVLPRSWFATRARQF